MGIRNFIAMLAAVVATTMVSSTGFAQLPWQETHDGHWSPLIEPDHFNPDYQFFAKAEIDDYGGWPEPNVGFFFSYERLYWNVGRSDYLPPELEPPQGDFAWGNRIEMGYMTHDDHGWLLSIARLGGPGEVLLVDTGMVLEDEDGFEVPILNEIPVNIATLNVVELAKVWRLKRNYHGGFCEILAGVRYTQFASYFQDTIMDIPVTFIPPPPAPAAPITVVVPFRLPDATVENNMLGGMIGLRWFRKQGRWLLSSDVKFIPSANFQIHRGMPRDPAQFPDLPPFSPSRDTFVPIGEVRVEATYDLTRDISIGSGFTLMYFGQGIGRGWHNPDVGPPDLFNNESLVVAGASIRVTLNR